MNTGLATVLRSAALLALCLSLAAVASAQVKPELRQRADRGDPEAQFTLGYMHVTGDGAPLDLAAASAWFRRAAEQGFAEALHWFRRAADQGVAAAQSYMGRASFNGDGVPRDLVVSHMWFSLAARQGDRLSAFYAQGRGEVEERMSQEQVEAAPRRAANWVPVPER